MVNDGTQPNRKDLVFITDILEKGKVKLAIDRQSPMTEVAGAIEYLKKGCATGNVVINM